MDHEFHLQDLFDSAVVHLFNAIIQAMAGVKTGKGIIAFASRKGIDLSLLDVAVTAFRISR